jgi:hypothetical protein
MKIHREWSMLFFIPDHKQKRWCKSLNLNVGGTLKKTHQNWNKNKKLYAYQICKTKETRPFLEIEY